MSEAIDLLDAWLARQNKTRADLARSIGVTQAMLYQVWRGDRRIPPLQLDAMSDALELNPEQRAELHRAAARDEGYQV